MDALPDVLGPGLRAVFCGTQAGRVSALRGAYYSGPGNKFWRILAEAGITPRRLLPHEYASLKELGLGLTDIAKRSSGPDAAIRRHDWDVEGFWRKIDETGPTFLAFNGKRGASVALGRPSRLLSYGFQPESRGRTRIAVLPSTSGAASGFWDVAPWTQLADALARSRS